MTLPTSRLIDASTTSPWRAASLRWRERREIKRLWTMPRRQTTSTALLGFPTWLVDGRSFLEQHREIFGRHAYRFASRSTDPFIVDGGANLGLSALYWKGLYPTARITCFEPDPAIFEILTRNCAQWGLTEVQLINAALWSVRGQADFWAEGCDSGRLAAVGATHEHA